jgi:hypothetical protein
MHVQLFNSAALVCFITELLYLILVQLEPRGIHTSPNAIKFDFLADVRWTLGINTRRC